MQPFLLILHFKNIHKICNQNFIESLLSAYNIAKSEHQKGVVWDLINKTTKFKYYISHLNAMASAKLLYK